MPRYELPVMPTFPRDHGRVPNHVTASLPSFPSSRLPSQSPSESYFPRQSCTAKA